MKLTADKLAALTHGAEKVTEGPDSVSFCRFTEEQQQFYKDSGNESFYLKTFTSAGVRLEFRTDSESLFLKINVPFATTRSYFAVDVCVNGELTGSIQNYSEESMTGNYIKQTCPTGRFEKHFLLGQGEKTVAVFLPWSVPTEIEELSIDDGSFAEPVAREKKMLVFGDSITQGYDALHPSKHYVSVLSGLLGADAYNKAIGGEFFVPALAATEESFVPDYILVAYGTNDWAHTELDRFRSSCREFYENLSRQYPASKIFALTPIWRTDHEMQYSCGTFASAADYIEEVAAGLANTYCLRGFDFVPHREELFGDLRLHPSDEGFGYYAKNVYDAIRKIVF